MLPTDPKLPQLQTVLDRDAMMVHFTRQINAKCPTKQLEIRKFELDRFRYRQHERAIVLYHLEIGQKGSRIVENQWVSVSIFVGGKALKAYTKAASKPIAYEGRFAGRFFPLVAYLDGLNGLVQWFPHDRHLPQIAELMAGKDCEVTALLQGPADTQSSAYPVIDFRPVRYRPGVGATVVASSSCEGQQAALAYVKIYRQLDPRLAYEYLSQLGLAAKTCNGAFGIVEPLGFTAGSQALALKPVSGASIEDAIAGDEQIEETAARSAKALAAFHMSGIRLPKRRTNDQVLARARRAADLLAIGSRDLIPRLDEISRRIEETLVEVPGSPTHLDMKADHVFCDDNSVHFIDMESCAMADPVYDPAMLLARLEMMPATNGVCSERASRFSKTFINTYFETVPDAWQARFSAAYKCASLKVALYFLQHLEQDWPRKVAGILDRALQFEHAHVV